jgi:Flp pilus assembly protein TadD
MTSPSRKQQLEAMLADEPNDPFLHYGLAMEYVSEGNDAEAVRRFRELLARTPDYVPAYLQAGQALLRLGDTDTARTLLETGIPVARGQGNQHAAEEMQGFLASIS